MIVSLLATTLQLVAINSAQGTPIANSTLLKEKHYAKHE